MWVHEKPSTSIGLVDVEQWAKNLGIFFKKIENSNLLSRQGFIIYGVQDTSAFFFMIPSEAPTGEACTCKDLQRVLETPLKQFHAGTYSIL
jgi:hypothetical protein